MKIRVGEREIPYPAGPLRGKLLLAGLSEFEVAQALEQISSLDEGEYATEPELYSLASKWLTTNKISSLEPFESLVAFDIARERSDGPPPIIVVLEGASATGKSLIAFEVLRNLAATRYISTDTVRQVLRGELGKDSHPEIHCHTYQAHKYKQEGPEGLHKHVRGFIAQTNLIQPRIIDLTKRVLSEGAMAVVEGVHIVPGTLGPLSGGVIEAVISPAPEMHEAMFYSKHSIGRLRSVSKDEKDRREEFEATRRIQKFMEAKARESGVAIVVLDEYEQAIGELSLLIRQTMDSLI
jgi:2-phosphoglycerate kinase